MKTICHVVLLVLGVLYSSVVDGKGTWAEQQSQAEKTSGEYQARNPNIRSEKFVFKTVTLPGGSTLDLDFRLERPMEGGPFPVVFYVHGGAWVTGSKSAFTHQSFELAKHGIAGVRLEYRWKKHGAKYPEAISDVMDAIDYVRQRAGEFNLDFTRVGLAGGSAGGHLSSIAAQMTPECICYDGYNGLFDALDRDRSRFGGGDYTGTTKQQKMAASAIYNIKTPPPNTFLYHGTADTTIDIKQAYRFSDAIRNKGGSAEVLAYEGAGHGFFNKDPYRKLTTEALLAHTSYVFGMTGKQPVLSEYALSSDTPSSGTVASTNHDRPNVIVIMTDDMGYSDLGCYGSEIQTPNLDQLANQGVRFSQFYNTSRCSPTRSSLMTGLYSHQAGMGLLTKDEGPGNPGYRGRLMDRCVTIAEVLGPKGYQCLATGKWHMGDAKKEWWPLGRGFDRFYGCPQGGGFYFRPSSWKTERFVVRDNEILYDKQNDPPEDWYATDAFTDEGIKYVEEAVEAKKPFFWYLAYNAPHFPLQAKPGDIAKYRGKYMAGWDKIREDRYQKLIELGLIDQAWKLSPRGDGIPAWSTLSEKQKEAQDERMAVYAGMVDCIDQNVGKIVARLKKMGVCENTLIVFLHDNGGQSGPALMGSNDGKGAAGTAESEVYYGTCWANVSDAPFRKYKNFIHEGGTATPLIAHWPKGIAASMNGKITNEPAHLIDLMATFVDISGATYPNTFKGHEIIPMEGESLLPILEARPFHRDAPIFFEHTGNRGLRLGKWKLVAVKGRPWELYDMQADRTELNNIAKEHVEKVRELSVLYDAWADRCFVTKKKKRKTKK